MGILLDEINVIYEILPTSIKGFSRLNEDDSYTIIINSKLNDIQQQNCFYHEIRHIENDDFYNFGNVDFIENIRHKEV